MGMATPEEIFYNGQITERKSYFDGVKEAMTWLGQQERTCFIGQTTEYAGTFMYPTLEGVPPEKRYEFPVQESFNVQFGIGAAVAGLIPIIQIPRINFLLLAFADIVNLLDKLPEMTDGKVNPHIIIRTAIGPDRPTDPKVQHKGDYTDAFLSSLNGVFVHNDVQEPGVRLFRPDTPEKVVLSYQSAYNEKEPCIVIEDGRLY